MIVESHEQLGFGHGRRQQSFVAPRLGTHARRPPLLLPTSAGSAHYVTDGLARGEDSEVGPRPHRPGERRWAASRRPIGIVSSVARGQRLLNCGFLRALWKPAFLRSSLRSWARPSLVCGSMPRTAWRTISSGRRAWSLAYDSLLMPPG